MQRVKYIVALLFVVLIFLAPTIVVPTTEAQEAYEKYRRPPDARYGGTLILADTYEPPHMQTAISSLSAPTSVGMAIFEPLIYVANDLETYLPGLAQSWEVSEDATTYTFHLVQNATWHDGVPFTSADVKLTMEVWKEYHPRLKKAIAPLDRIETPDDYTAKVIFTKPWTPFLSGVAYARDALISVAKHLYENTDVLTNPHNVDPTGTGAFKFKEWVSGSHIELERNDDYWIDGQPYIDGIIFRYMPDEIARVSAYETGAVDHLHHDAFLSPASVDVIEKLPDTVVTTNATGLMLPIPLPIIFNLRNPIVDNLKVRKAIAWAVDKDAIIESVYRGLASRQHGFFTNASPWYNPNMPKYYPRNIDKANELLDEAGYPRGPDGTRFQLKYTYDHVISVEQKPAEIIISNLKDVGIEVIDQGGESVPTWEMMFIDHNFDIATVRYGTGPDPYIGISRMYLSTNIGDALFNNGAAYVNAEVDELWDKIASTADPATRKEYYWQVQEIVQEDLPYIWLVDGTTSERNVYRESKIANLGTWADSLGASYHTIYFKAVTAATPAIDWTLIGGVGIACLAIGLVAGYLVSRKR